MSELKLYECARILRSKNAGAFVLTIDVMFATQQHYDDVMASGRFTSEAVAVLYRVKPDEVRIIPYPQVLAVKVTMPRHVGSGDLRDTDVYGSQQHVPLMYLSV